MAKERREHDSGTRLRPTDPSVSPLSKDGDILVDSTDSDRLKIRQDGVDREVTTNDDTQTLENKTIDGTDATGNNTVLTDADDVSFDNTSNGFTADNAQAAIEEVQTNVDAIGTPNAVDIPFDNTTNGFTAADVQAAIEEAAQTGSGGGSAAGTTYDNTNSGLAAVNVQEAIDEIVGVIGGQVALDSIEVASGTTVTFPNEVYIFGAPNHKFFRNGVLMTKVTSFSTVVAPAIENFAHEYIEVDNGENSNTITLHPNFPAEDDLFQFIRFSGISNLLGGSQVVEITTGTSVVFPTLTYQFGSENHRFFRNGVLMEKVASFTPVTNPLIQNFAHEYIEVDNGSSSNEITLHPNFPADNDSFELLKFAGLEALDDASNIDYDGTSSGLTATDVQGAIDEVQGNVDTLDGTVSTLSSNFSNHESASSNVHGIGTSSSVVGTETTQTLTNKTLTSPDIDTPDIDGGTIDGATITTSKVGGGTASATNKVLATADTKANLDALAREAGSLYFATDELKLYFDDGTQLVDLSSSGGGMSYNSRVNQIISGVAAYTIPAGTYFQGTITYQLISSGATAETHYNLTIGEGATINITSSGSPGFSQIDIDGAIIYRQSAGGIIVALNGVLFNT